MKNLVVSAAMAITLLSAANFTSAGDGTPNDPIVFGVVPARSPEQVIRTFGPIIDAMAGDLGIAVQIRGAPDYETFLRRILDGETYDAVIAGGDTIQFIRDRDIYRPIAQMAGPGVFSVIVTLADSQVTDLEGLAGARVATADVLAYSTGLAFRTLERVGIDPQADLNIAYVPSQSASLQALLQGQVDVSIVMIPVIRSAPENVRQSLRILAESELAAPPAVSVATSMDTELAIRIAGFFVGLRQRDGGTELLRQVGWPGFAPINLEVYDALDWAAESMAERLEGATSE